MARPRQITNEQIIDATRAAVDEHGAQVSLDLVAQRLGVTSPALLKRFGSRKKLLFAALIPDPEELDALLDVPVDDRPVAEQLVEILDLLSGYMQRTYPRVMALRECVLSDDQVIDELKRPMPLVAIRAMTRWLDALAARGRIDGTHAEAAATSLVGGVSTRMMSAYLSRRPWTRRSQLAFIRAVSALFERALTSPSLRPRTSARVPPRRRSAAPSK